MKWDGKPYKKKNPVITKSANKDNAPPSDPDHQDVPQSMKEFMKLKQLAAAEYADSKKKKKKSNLKNSEKQQPSVKNKKKELSNVTHTPAPESTSDSSSSKANTRKEKLQGLKKKKRLKFQKLKEKRKLKKLEQKEKVTVDTEENLKDIRREEIKFGEVAHRPPQISVRPRKVTKTGFENRPGRKDDLLLKSLLKDTSYGKEARTPLTDKRKNLSVSDQRQIEVERQKAMLAYKNMKHKQSKLNNSFK